MPDSYTDPEIVARWSRSKVNRSLALLTGKINPDSSGFDTARYITDYKVFICPSSVDVPTSNGVLTTRVSTKVKMTYIKHSCSYAYALGLTQQTHPDTAIMADTKAGYSSVSKPAVAGFYGSGRW